MDRFTLCLEDGLLKKLDEISAERGYPSRSQAMADFIRRAIVKKDWTDGRECAGTISVHYPSGKNGPLAGVEEILSASRDCIAGMTTDAFGVLKLTRLWAIRRHLSPNAA